MDFKLPKLPYAYNALEPYIDEQTMRIHHTKHHQAYIDKLNAALEGKNKFKGKSVEEIISNLSAVPEDIRTAVRNHGGGHANHSFFWQVMGPKTSGKPTGDILDSIESAFGSFEDFKKKFSEVAASRFGSGWGWLVASGQNLEVYSTGNQDSPLMEGKTPVLGIDVWEHSYYLKYQNRRPDYIEAFFNVINWGKVSEFYSKANK